jgi:hypothetical protein
VTKVKNEEVNKERKRRRRSKRMDRKKERKERKRVTATKKQGASNWRGSATPTNTFPKSVLCRTRDRAAGS